MTRVQICTVCGQKLWAITAVFLNIYSPGVLLLVSLLIFLELLTLKIGALHLGGYQSTSRNNPESPQSSQSNKFWLENRLFIQAADVELEDSLDAALEAGYRHIDTAYVYENEEAIGRVLAKWLNSGKVKREELFIVTKLPPVGNHPDRVEKYLKRSLDKLGLDYVDMYLVHVPFGLLERGEEIHPMGDDGNILLDKSTNHVDIWKAMEAQVDVGRTKAIGLSNFNVMQIKRILQAARIPPANLQVELHVLCQQNELVELCKEHDILVCAYSPLGSRGTENIYKTMGISKDFPDLLNNPTVLEVAKKHGKTPAQILLRHIVQRGIAAIPKSTNPERIRQNLQVHDFELTSDDMLTLNKLDRGSDGRILDFGFFKGIRNHPEFPF